MSQTGSGFIMWQKHHAFPPINQHLSKAFQELLPFTSTWLQFYLHKQYYLHRCSSKERQRFKFDMSDSWRTCRCVGHQAGGNGRSQSTTDRHASCLCGDRENWRHTGRSSHILTCCRGDTTYLWVWSILWSLLILSSVFHYVKRSLSAKTGFTVFFLSWTEVKPSSMLVLS